MTTITGTAAGGLADTQEVMDLCAKNNIEPDTELGGYYSTQISDISYQMNPEVHAKWPSFNTSVFY